MWTWISILKCSNALKASLLVNVLLILRSQPTAFGIQHFVYSPECNLSEKWQAKVEPLIEKSVPVPFCLSPVPNGLSW
jgi:hypothetical protein